MRSSLDLVAGFLSSGKMDALSMDWSKVRYQHMSAVRAALAEAYAPSTANKMLSAVKGVLKECTRLGYTSAEDYAKSSDIPSVKGYRAPKGRALSKSELSRVFSCCAQDGNRSRGLRDYAILAVMYSSGLRRSEVSSLDTGDYDNNADGPGYLTVRSGKGNMDRLSPINPNACESIERWLNLQQQLEEEELANKPLFNPIAKSEKILSNRRMTDQGVLYVLQRRARESRVASFTPHDLRRTFIGDLLDAGADIATVQQLAGHANVQTTARYDRRGEQAKRKAASLLDIP
ncbi:tyrosine-type recombinase/integrase [soil metagenome]|jgi:site-specific recombinase XerD